MGYNADREYWTVYCYNEADAQFGYDPGAQVHEMGLDKAVAKWIARFMDKKSPKFVHYWAEPEPERYW